jgi:hypothetical protein
MHTGAALPLCNSVLTADAVRIHELEVVAPSNCHDAEHPKRIIELPLPASVGKEFAIRFSLPDAISPKQIGLNEDRRQLGLMVCTIELH